MKEHAGEAASIYFLESKEHVGEAASIFFLK